MEIKVEQPSEDKLAEIGVKSWPVWTKETSEFDWHYGEQEICYLVEGKVEIETKTGATVKLKPGDLVTFPKGLSCTWKIKEDVKKHYKLG